jgi:hypothetical protein
MQNRQHRHRHRHNPTRPEGVASCIVLTKLMGEAAKGVGSERLRMRRGVQAGRGVGATGRTGDGSQSGGTAVAQELSREVQWHHFRMNNHNGAVAACNVA